MIRVLVIASSVPAGERLARLLRATSRFKVVVLSAGGRERREDLADHEADVVVGEVESGYEDLAQEISEWAASGEAVVLLLEDRSFRVVRDALRAGVKAILPHGVTGRELAAAVDGAAAGLTVLAPEQAEDLYEPPSRIAGRDGIEFTEALTAREVEVLRLVAEGLGNKEIASRLDISEHTAKFHVASILGKLGAASRTEAVTAGIRRGLIIV